LGVQRIYNGSDPKLTESDQSRPFSTPTQPDQPIMRSSYISERVCSGCTENRVHLQKEIRQEI